jgi:hypothetical protein
MPVKTSFAKTFQPWLLAEDTVGTLNPSFNVAEVDFNIYANAA